MRRRLRSKAISPTAPDLPLTIEQQRSVACPRCSAKVGQPCRDQRDRAVSAGHADRQREARRLLRRELVRATPVDRPLTPQEHAELEARRRAVHDPALLPRPRRLRTDNG